MSTAVEHGVSIDDLETMNVWRLSWRVSQHRRKEFWLGSLLFIYFFIAPAFTGFALSRGYAAIATVVRPTPTGGPRRSR